MVVFLPQNASTMSTRLVVKASSMARFLAGARVVRGFSQSDLAAKVGTSSGYISELERARRNPSPMLLLKLLNRLGVKRTCRSTGVLRSIVYEPPSQGRSGGSLKFEKGHLQQCFSESRIEIEQ